MAEEGIISGYLVLPDLLTRPEDRAVGNWGENPDVPHGGTSNDVRGLHQPGAQRIHEIRRRHSSDADSLLLYVEGF